MRMAAIASLLLCLIAVCPVNAASAAQTTDITDAMGRSVSVPQSPGRAICSGAGCLQLLTYLQAKDRAVALDDMEKREISVDPRPYALANPQSKELPLFGEFRGQDNPELIAALDPAPQVIFKTSSGMGTDPSELQQKTGIRVERVRLVGMLAASLMTAIVLHF